MWLETSETGYRRHPRGASLLEALITAALFSIVIAGVYLLYTTMQNTLSRGELKTELQQNARVGLDRMIQEIRMAGYPTGIAVQVATQTCLSIFLTLPGSPYTNRTYRFDGTTNTLRRDGGDGAGAQPLAESVNQLSFTYYDAYSQVLMPSSGTAAPCASSAGLSSWQLRQIRRVGISLRTGGSLPGAAPEFYTLTADVFLRNQ